jgi:hypothetical protein
LRLRAKAQHREHRGHKEHKEIHVRGFRATSCEIPNDRHHFFVSLCLCGLCALCVAL